MLKEGTMKNDLAENGINFLERLPFVVIIVLVI